MSADDGEATSGLVRARPGEPSDAELRELLVRLRSMSAEPFHVAGAERSRAFAASLRPTGRTGPDMAQVIDHEMPVDEASITVREYRPRGAPHDFAVVYFHGGGWVVGGIVESDSLCRTLADETGLAVFSVDYRLAPEHRFPTAVDDADAAATWAVERLGGGGRIALLGDSAGGNLAAVVARRFTERGDDRIAMQVLVYPVTDHRMTTPSYVEHAEPRLIGSDDMRWFWDQYVPDMTDRSHPDASPLMAADLRGLPPALVVVAEWDPLRDETLAYARQMSEAGVQVTVDRYPTMAHGFFPLVDSLTTSRTAVRSVATVLRHAQ